MSTGMLSIGITGIHAAQLGLQVTQHNIANANTTGYNRQYIQQSAGIPMQTGAGYVGSGANVDSVRRAYDQYLTQQTFAVQSQVSESDTLTAKLTQIDNLLADPSAGLAPAIQDFFTGLQQLTANPSLTSARQSMLSSAEVLTSRFNFLAGRMSDLSGSVNGEIANEMQQVNLYAAQIGQVNEQITKAQAASGQPPNDLLDMRDQLVAELNKHIKVSTVEDSVGNFNVFIGNGQQLVVGNQVNTLVPVNSSSDPERVVVALKGQSGTLQELPESLIQGGALGGLLRFRSESLDSAMGSLDAIAASLVLTFNAQHALGQDIDGLNANSPAGSGFAADFFTIAAPTVVADSATADPVSVSLQASGDPASGNFAVNWTGSDYVLRHAAGGDYTLTRTSDGTVFSGTTLAELNTAIAGDGLRIDDEPTVDVNYQIRPPQDIALNLKVNSDIAADTARIAIAAPSITTLGSNNSGSLTVSQGIAGFKSDGSRYSLPGAGGVTFAYNGTALTFPAGADVTAHYADGTTADGASGTVNWQNAGGSKIERISYNGITLDLSGNPVNGDSFKLLPNVNGVADNRNGVRLAALQTQNTTDGGKSTYQTSYASLVSKVGSETRQAKVTGEAQTALLEQSEAARSAVSGVNLDEEAANLIKYQQAYQASAKALQISTSLFDTLLGIMN